MATNSRKVLSIAARIVLVLIAVGLLFFTIKRTDANIVRAICGSAKCPLVFAVVLYGVVQLLGAWRWKLLLRVQSLDLPLWTALRLTLAGGFFSLLIPGSVSGDILKIACAAQIHPGHAAELTLVDLFDRIIGLSGIFFAAAIATAASASWLPGLLSAEGAGWMLTCAVAAINLGCLAVIALYVLFLTRPKWMQWRIAQRISALWSRLAPARIRDIIGRMIASAELFRNRQRVIAAALALSIVIHLMVSGTIFCLGRALHECNMSAGQYILTTQLANVTGILPITPGGIGLRDAVTAALFGFFRAEPAAVQGDIPLINSLIIVFWGLLGALLYAFSPSLKHQT